LPWAALVQILDILDIAIAHGAFFMMPSQEFLVTLPEEPNYTLALCFEKLCRAGLFSAGLQPVCIVSYCLQHGTARPSFCWAPRSSCPLETLTPFEILYPVLALPASMVWLSSDSFYPTQPCPCASTLWCLPIVKPPSTRDELCTSGHVAMVSSQVLSPHPRRQTRFAKTAPEGSIGIASEKPAVEKKQGCYAFITRKVIR
jgi:hypothetical protein